MQPDTRPLVSIVTPVYNEEKYLPECVESILAQTYSNWEYTIIDNRSTDRSLEIATSYARRDSRIRVQSTPSFVGVIENHNNAFRSISRESKYCKVVSGDDWIYPECLERLVEAAESNPTAGMVGSYAINDWGVRWCSLPIRQTFLEGYQAGRRFLLGEIDSFWVPSSVLYRSDVVRSEHDFFPGTAPSGDLSACLRTLRSTDFVFVHQILSYERVHPDSESAAVKRMDSYLLDWIAILDEFAGHYLDPTEHAARRKALFDIYYRDVIGVGLVNGRSDEFWGYHKERLNDLGYPWDSARAWGAASRKALDLLLNPKSTFEKLIRRAGVKAK